MPKFYDDGFKDVPCDIELRNLLFAKRRTEKKLMNLLASLIHSLGALIYFLTYSKNCEAVDNTFALLGLSCPPLLSVYLA